MHAELTITATEHQARSLRIAHSIAIRDQGEHVWEAPQILSLDRYARDIWLQSWPEELLLSPSQELLLWQQCLEQQDDYDGLISNRQLAALMQSSYQRACRWMLNWQTGAYWTREQQFFARTAQFFENALKQRTALSAAQVTLRVADLLSKQRIRPPKSLQTYGFNEASDASARHLLQVFSKAGCELQDLPRRTANTQSHYYCCPDERTQWRHIARDLRLQLQDTPQFKFVVAVPRLTEALRQHIDVNWREEFAAELLSPLASPSTTIWAYEQSESLADQPAIAAALSALRPSAYGNRFEELSALLLNPLLFNAEERTYCARTEAALRELGSKASFRQILVHLPADLPSDLHERLHTYDAALIAAPNKAKALEWLEHWQQRWQALQYKTRGEAWPLGEEFDQALLEFAGLHDQLGKVTSDQALGWLSHILQQQRYQDAHARNAPIRICDLDTALALQADRHILANMNARELPLGASPDPFLRLEDQISAAMPTASPALRLSQAQTWIAQLQSHADELDVYCPLSNAEGVMSQANPLVSGPWLDCPILPEEDIFERLAQPRVCDPVPPLDTARQARQTGAVKVVQSQAHGSFFGFVRHRLEVAALPSVLEGLSALAQGQWIHAVLQSFWQSHRNRSALLKLSDEALRHDVRERTAALAERYVPLARYGKHLQAAESDRVLRCCEDWLNHERRRIDDFTVVHCEAELQQHIAPFDFRLRIDRIDRCDTEFGPRYLVIDYKTGSGVEKKYWDTHQFYEPQLPVYACSERLKDLGVPQVDGICFAHVAELSPAFVASLNWRKRLITEDAKPYFTDWDQTLALWRGRLDELIREYCAGGCAYDAQLNYSRRYPVVDLLELIDADTADEDSDDEDTASW